MQNTNDLIHVFECKSLSDFWSQILNQSSRRSIRNLSARLGYKSDRSLGMVVQQKRPMNRKMILKIAKHFSLSAKEREYLQLLADIQKSKTNDEKIALQQSLSQIHPAEPKNIVILKDKFQAFHSWLCFPILNVIEAFGENAKLDSIVGFFPVSVRADILKTIESLVEIGLINKGQSEVLKVDEGAVYRTTQDIPSKSVREYHRQSLEAAAQSLDAQSVMEREFLARSIKVKKSRILDFKKRMREYLSQLDSEFSESPNGTDAVYQLNLQLFKVVDFED